MLDQQRVIVTPQQELYELACAYVAQRDFGNLEGQAVGTLDDAYLAPRSQTGGLSPCANSH